MPLAGTSGFSREPCSSSEVLKSSDGLSVVPCGLVTEPQSGLFSAPGCLGVTAQLPHTPSVALISPSPSWVSARPELSSLLLPRWVVLTPSALFPLQELARNEKDSEEKRWNKRTLQLLKTLQVAVLGAEVRCQKRLLISARPCQGTPLSLH